MNITPIAADSGDQETFAKAVQPRLDQDHQGEGQQEQNRLQPALLDLRGAGREDGDEHDPERDQEDAEDESAAMGQAGAGRRGRGWLMRLAERYKGSHGE